MQQTNFLWKICSYRTCFYMKWVDLWGNHCSDKMLKKYKSNDILSKRFCFFVISRNLHRCINKQYVLICIMYFLNDILFSDNKETNKFLQYSSPAMSKKYKFSTTSVYRKCIFIIPFLFHIIWYRDYAKYF